MLTKSCEGYLRPITDIDSVRRPLSRDIRLVHSLNIQGLLVRRLNIMKLLSTIYYDLLILQLYKLTLYYSIAETDTILYIRIIYLVYIASPYSNFILTNIIILAVL